MLRTGTLLVRNSVYRPDRCHGTDRARIRGVSADLVGRPTQPRCPAGLIVDAFLLAGLVRLSTNSACASARWGLTSEFFRRTSHPLLERCPAMDSGNHKEKRRDRCCHHHVDRQDVVRERPLRDGEYRQEAPDPENEPRKRPVSFRFFLKEDRRRNKCTKICNKSKEQCPLGKPLIFPDEPPQYKRYDAEREA